MIIDSRLEFSDSGDFANETGTANVGSTVDLGAATRDIGQGQPFYLIIVVETAADGGGGGNATVAFQLASDASDPPATTGAQTIHFTSDAYTAAQLPQGRRFVFPLPAGAASYERYLGLQLVTGTEGEDALVCSAFLTTDPTGWTSYPDASN